MLSVFVVRLCTAVALGTAVIAAEIPASRSNFSSAYTALSSKDYDSAIDLFRKGLVLDSSNAAVHKDLAYTLLKAGENAQARDEFESTLKINPHDESAALEFAFLAYETGKPIEARRMFDRLRKQGSAATRATAEQAFQNIDRPLAEGIARWKQALARSANPNDVTMFSAHWELTRTAELRDDLPLAAEQYEICRTMKPQLSEILLMLARVWRQLNRVEDAKAAVLAASRQENPRTAEQGLEEWGPRYPYAYEFLNAIALDPRNLALRRELGYLYLAINKEPEAIEQFERVLVIDPNDKLSRDQLDLLRHPKKASVSAPLSVTTGAPSVDTKQMGLKSLSFGYARDAIKYLRQAHDQNPDDEEVMLKLGWAYNYAHDDQDALKWFDRVRHSSNPAIAAEAAKAFRNLSGDTSGQSTLWALPMYSSRWHDVFSYSQIKRTLPLPWTPMNRWLSVYLSARFIGDINGSMPQSTVTPMYLSDSAFILGGGVATRTWRHLRAWGEAGESFKYLPSRHDVGSAVPDYRGGVNFAKGLGRLLGAERAGLFFETTADAVYVSRYAKDWIFSSQNRSGWTFHSPNKTSAQLYFNANATHDLKNQYWAETVEMGPGAKFHAGWMRPGVYLSADFIRGIYTNNLENPHRPNYNDVRIGFWYAFTK